MADRLRKGGLQYRPRGKRDVGSPALKWVPNRFWIQLREVKTKKKKKNFQTISGKIKMNLLKAVVKPGQHIKETCGHDKKLLTNKNV